MRVEVIEQEEDAKPRGRRRSRLLVIIMVVIGTIAVWDRVAPALSRIFLG